MEAELASWLGLLRDGGIVVLLLAVLIGGARGYWIFGWQHRAWMDSKDRQIAEWRDLALGSRELAQRSARLAERAMDRSPEGV